MREGVKLYTIRDDVAQEFGPVYEAVNDGVAIRGYRHLCIKQQVVPTEYRLFCIGLFDYGSMVLIPYDPIVEIDISTGGLDEK